MENQEQFKIGQFIEVTNDIYSKINNSVTIPKGSKGKIVRLAITGAVGVAFENINDGHDCNKTLISGSKNGKYITIQNFNKIKIIKPFVLKSNQNTKNEFMNLYKVLQKC